MISFLLKLFLHVSGRSHDRQALWSAHTRGSFIVDDEGKMITTETPRSREDAEIEDSSSSSSEPANFQARSRVFGGHFRIEVDESEDEQLTFQKEKQSMKIGKEDGLTILYDTSKETSITFGSTKIKIPADMKIEVEPRTAENLPADVPDDSLPFVFPTGLTDAEGVAWQVQPTISGPGGGPIVIVSQCNGDFDRARFFGEHDYTCKRYQSSIYNHMEYAKQHGYGYLVVTKPLSSRLKTYDRFIFVPALFNAGASWVFNIEIDAVFMNRTRAIEEIIFSFPKKDLIASGDWNVGFLGGNFLARNSDWCKQLFCDAWRICPSEGWDQMGSIMSLLGGGSPEDPASWSSGFYSMKTRCVTESECNENVNSKLPISIAAHYIALPTRAMSSQVAEGIMGESPPPESLYQKGDWIVHLAGHHHKASSLITLSRMSMIEIGQEDCGEKVFVNVSCKYYQYETGFADKSNDEDSDEEHAENNEKSQRVGAERKSLALTGSEREENEGFGEADDEGDDVEMSEEGGENRREQEDETSQMDETFGDHERRSFGAARRESPNDMSDEEAAHLAHAVRAEIQFVYQNYKAHAWGCDEIKPLSGECSESMGIAVTALDSLDTLFLADLRVEFDELATWVAHHFRIQDRGQQSVFETTIRALGGLASAHALSGHPGLKAKLVELADALLPAFHTESGVEAGSVNLLTAEKGPLFFMPDGSVTLADAGSLGLEFRYVTHVTGDRRYQKAVDRGESALLQIGEGSRRGLIGSTVEVDGSSGNAEASGSVSVSAGSDSYYEYLLKQYIQTGKTEVRFERSWTQAMNDMLERLVATSPGGDVYLREHPGSESMGHLACFAPGMLELGYRTLDDADERWHKTAVALAETCHKMYITTRSSLSPEIAGFSGKTITVENGNYHLRPEVAESLYYLHYFTGDARYRRMAADIFNAIVKNCKTKYAFAEVEDVAEKKPVLINRMESFFVAETLKYLYLIFAPPGTVDLKRQVFNTEGHPLPIWKGRHRGTERNPMDFENRRPGYGRQFRRNHLNGAELNLDVQSDEMK